MDDSLDDAAQQHGVNQTLPKNRTQDRVVFWTVPLVFFKSLPLGNAHFHLIKVYDVSWDTKPDKLIHKSISYYHKLLFERRLQRDARQRVLWFP